MIWSHNLGQLYRHLLAALIWKYLPLDSYFAYCRNSNGKSYETFPPAEGYLEHRRELRQLSVLHYRRKSPYFISILQNTIQKLQYVRNGVPNTLITSRLRRFFHLDSGNEERVTSCSPSCSGETYSIISSHVSSFPTTSTSFKNRYLL